MLLKRILVLVTMLASVLLWGCSDVQLEFREVYVIEGETTFRYVNPQDGKDTFSQIEMLNTETYFIYIYIPIDGVEFDYTQFFSALGDHFVYSNIHTGKFYIKSSEDIDTLITQFYLDRQAFDLANPQ